LEEDEIFSYDYQEFMELIDYQEYGKERRSIMHMATKRKREIKCEKIMETDERLTEKIDTELVWYDVVWGK
jgi:hypothetical protein